MSPPRVAHVINSIGLGGVPESVFHLLRTMPPGGAITLIGTGTWFVRSILAVMPRRSRSAMLALPPS
jgi:hypothetical protein